MQVMVKIPFLAINQVKVPPRLIECMKPVDSGNIQQTLYNKRHAWHMHGRSGDIIDMGRQPYMC